jgi:cob(I)alamin adenosyltransferase
MELLSRYSTSILIILMILLAVTLVFGVVAMGSQRFGPRFRNKLMRVRVALHGLVVLILALLILSGIYGKGSSTGNSGMVKLDKIYTRGGDGGETSLAGGRRVPKHDLRVAAMGTVDEANAVIGIARLHLDGEAGALLGRIQNDLFDLGADLARPEDAKRGTEGLRMAAAQVQRLEQEIDACNEKLEPLTSFVLPGGSPAAAHLHHARAVTRRAERLVAELDVREGMNKQALAYLNRLSDLLFVLARSANADGASDVLWIPGENRN